jgi:hypothetical protein
MTTTDRDIEALRLEALHYGDLEQATICVLALGGPEFLEGSEPGTEGDRLLRAGRTQEWARAECERVIADAAARAND